MTDDVVADLQSRNFRPRVYGVGAWTNHVHFAYDIVAALRPRVLVELGTDRGESYFAFCQSVQENDTATRCFAVDTWRGDQQAGDYDETTFRQVSAHAALHYAAFSTLLRMRFDEAAVRFADDSIDLLHLDGLHTEAAVRHDLAVWLPKLRRGGVLLMHDVDVRQYHFGVHVVWDELRKHQRAFTFHFGPGLGLFQKENGTPPPLLAALFAGGDLADRLVDYYRNCAEQLHAHIAQQWRDGSIRHTAVAGQTIIQIFHSRDGVHSEENSVLARVGHDEWKSLRLEMPAGAGASPLRVDFVSAFTAIDIESLIVRSGDDILFRADAPVGFDEVRIAGDCIRQPHERYLCLQITGIDPQLYLPALNTDAAPERLSVELKLRVTAAS